MTLSALFNVQVNELLPKSGADGGGGELGGGREEPE